VVVFVDELNKYAPGDGPETYVKKMLLDLSERGRYLGLVLFSAQQFRSQVQRRVVGNAGTAIYGRMDSDELAMPAYQTLSPAVKSKLAALPKGELMVRHPHFTQPIFVKFPRPAVLSGREGVERFPPQPDIPFAEAMWRQLHKLDRSITRQQVGELCEGRKPEDVRRAVHAARRVRPDSVIGFIKGAMGKIVPAEQPKPRGGVGRLKGGDDPYA
jgi:DNA helicase HerA-like ATPase